MADDFLEQYKHPNWQRKRLQILERDSYECRWCCASDDELHVHHLEYTKGHKVWDYSDDNFITLCKTCHEHAGDVLLDVKRKLWNVVYLNALQNLSIAWTTEAGRKRVSKSLNSLAMKIVKESKCRKDS